MDFFIAEDSMSNDMPFSDDYEYTEDGIPILRETSSLKLYVDFCPSEYIKKDTLTPDSTFVSSACFFVPIVRDSERKIKKFSNFRNKGAKMNYLNKVLEMIKLQHIAVLSICLLNSEEEHYKNGLRKAMNKIDEIRSTDIGKRANQDQIASISGVFSSAYIFALYFLLMEKLHEMYIPQHIEIIIDRLPSPMSGDNLELFNVIHETCYNDRIPSRNITVRVLDKNEKDPPGLMFADMMAHICASWITLKNAGEESNRTAMQVGRSKQLPKGYTDEHYRHFALFNNLLVEEKECFVVVTMDDVIKMCNIVGSGIVSG